MSECPTCNGVGIRVEPVRGAAFATVCECKNPCPTCGGAGYFFETDQYGYRNAVSCQCTRLSKRAQFFNDAQIPSRYAFAEFGKIKTDPGAPDMMNARRMAWRFAREAGIIR